MKSIFKKVSTTVNTPGNPRLIPSNIQKMMFTRVLFPVKNIHPIQTLPFFLFWPKRLFLTTFNECGRKNQSKSIHKCFTVIVSNGPIDSSIVRQLDSPTLLHKNWQKMKITYRFVLFESLCTVYIFQCFLR